MNSPNRGPAKARKKPTPLMTPSRVILFGLLFAAMAVFAIDRFARAQASAAYERLRPHFQDQGDAPGAAQPAPISQAQVRESIGKESDGPAEQETNLFVESYSWSGIVRRYTLHVVYSDRSLTKMLEAELNRRFDAAPAQ